MELRDVLHERDALADHGVCEDDARDAVGLPFSDRRVQGVQIVPVNGIG